MRSVVVFPQPDVERAARHLEVERVDRRHFAETLRDPLKADVGLIRVHWSRPYRTHSPVVQHGQPSTRPYRFAAMATREVESKGLKADARAGVRLQRRDRGRVDRAATRSPPRRAPANVNG